MEEEEEEEYDMCQAIREWIEDERKAGYEEGIKEGIREGIEEGIEEACRTIRKAGFEPGQIAKIFGKTEEEVKAILACGGEKG